MTTVLTERQQKVYEDRFMRDGEPVEAMWRRVAKGAAAVESNDAKRVVMEDLFYTHLLSDFKYVPGGRILRAIGADTLETAMNCYVLPSPEDSREGIIRKSLGDWTELMSLGGGVGINVSSLRPRGFPVKKSQGISSGPISWAELFAFISKLIEQGGSRRGAAMIMIDDWHPDVFEFIAAKETPGRLEGCNMSVCISNAFMKALASGGDWQLKWDGVTVHTIKAQKLWDAILNSAWASGEPGIYFMERANDMANSGYFEKFESTNPCGEQPLGPYGACLLGAVNLTKFVWHDLQTGKVNFDFESLARIVQIAVRFNDNVIDAANYPLVECRESQQNIRRMGIGVMGLADAMIELGHRYGSDSSVAFTAKVFETMRNAAYTASVVLAEERGPFPSYSYKYLERPFIKALPEYIQRKIRKSGIRNCYLLTQAPTGTTSALANVNGGIEPYFRFSYERNDRIGVYRVDEGKPEWAAAYDEKGPHDALVTSMDVTPDDHVRVQAAAQKYVDSSISKTVNLPSTATVEDVAAVYMQAWEEGLKSVTVYRDKSRQQQVLNELPSESDELDVEWDGAIGTITEDNGYTIKVALVGNSQAEAPSPQRRRLPDTRPALTHKFRVGEQEGYATVGFYPGTQDIGEMFVEISKGGSTLAEMTAFGFTMFSIARQYGAPLDVLLSKMIGTKFEPAGMTANPEIRNASSITDYLGRWLNELSVQDAWYESFDKAWHKTQWEYVVGQMIDIPVDISQPANTAVSVLANSEVAISSGDACPSCGNLMIRQEGCLSCPCGESRC